MNTQTQNYSDVMAPAWANRPDRLTEFKSQLPKVASFETMRAEVKAHYGLENVEPALKLIRLFREIYAN